MHSSCISLALKGNRRRLLRHVLPARFVKIRHSGLFAARQVTTALPLARQFLARRPAVATPGAPPPWAALLLRLTGIDVTRCPRCQQTTLDRRVLRPRAGRAPP